MAAAGLMALALLGQGPPRTYYWRDPAGQTHITNTPPPADAVLLDAPPPPAVEPGQASRPPIPRLGAGPGGSRQLKLSPAQKQAWEALDLHLAKAREAGDRRTLEAVTDSMISDSLWGGGLWAMPALPVLTVALLGFLGWWLALGLRAGSRGPLVVGFLLLGLLLGDLFLHTFLYQPQAARLRKNLELLEQHLGTGRPPRPERRGSLQARYRALEEAAENFQSPLRFPAAVEATRAEWKQVMVDP